MTFLEASAVERAGEARFKVSVPDGWQQGRGAFGGLVLGTLARAMEQTEPDPARTLRTLAGDLCGPVLAGAADVEVHVLRRGSHQSNLRAELKQEGKVLASATAVFSPPRPGPVSRVSLSPPAASDWQAVPVLELGPPFGPAFAAHYEYRNQGPEPFSGGERAETGGWIRERERLATLDAASVIGRLDAWWPTLFSVDEGPRPMGTIQFTAELLTDPRSLDPAEPLRHRATMISLYDGFFLEFRELWRGPQPVALNQQTFAIIR
jgi:hypothetical protein